MTNTVRNLLSSVLITLRQPHRHVTRRRLHAAIHLVNRVTNRGFASFHIPLPARSVLVSSSFVVKLLVRALLRQHALVGSNIHRKIIAHTTNARLSTKTNLSERVSEGIRSAHTLAVPNLLKYAHSVRSYLTTPVIAQTTPRNAPRKTITIQHRNARSTTLLQSRRRGSIGVITQVVRYVRYHRTPPVSN